MASSVSSLRRAVDRLRAATGQLSNGRAGDGGAAVQSLAWSGLAQVTGLCFRLGSNLILTRLLAPADFAVIGTAMTVMTIMEWVSDAGLYPAVIRHAQGDTTQYLSTSWWMGLIRASGLSLLILAAAWPLGRFYDVPQLLPILLILAARPLILALRSPGFPLLRRNLNYRALFIDETGQTVAGTLVSLGLALLLRSPVAIAWGTLAGACASVMLSWWLNAVRPGPWCAAAARDLFSFCRQVLPNTLVMAIWLNLDRTLGLRMLPPADMGCYFLAINLAAVVEGISVRGCDVYFSFLSRMNDESQRARTHTIITRSVTRWLMPMLLMAALVAEPCVRLLYDARYELAGPLLAVLIVRLMIRILGQLHFQYLMAAGRIHSSTRAYLTALGVQAALLVPLVHSLGVVGLALSCLLSTIVVTIAQMSVERDIKQLRQPLLQTLAWMAVALLFVTCSHSMSADAAQADPLLTVEQTSGQS